MNSAARLSLVCGTLLLAGSSQCGPKDRDRFQQSMFKVHQALRGVEGYRKSQGKLPSGLGDVCHEDPRECSYDSLARWVRDGWGRPLRYGVIGAGFEVRSSGRDGRANTRDDLVLWSDSVPGTVHAVAGCYRISRDWWRLTSRAVIALDTNPARAAEYEIVQPNFEGKTGTWYPLPDHQVYIEWRDVGGFASLWLQDFHDSLAGDGVHATDISLHGSYEDIVLRRANCER
jgi:hypothetical protein